MTGVDPILAAALAPVLRDLRSTGVAEPRLEDSDWAGHPDQVGAMMWSTVNRSGAGVWALRTDSAVDRIVGVADQVQEWAVEELWSHAPTNWPPCPHHPTTHPLQASSRDGVAVWVCPADGAPFQAIGSLGP